MRVLSYILILLTYLYSKFLECLWEAKNWSMAEVILTKHLIFTKCWNQWTVTPIYNLLFIINLCRKISSLNQLENCVGLWAACLCFKPQLTHLEQNIKTCLAYFSLQLFYQNYDKWIFPKKASNKTAV